MTEIVKNSLIEELKKNRIENKRSSIKRVYVESCCWLLGVFLLGSIIANIMAILKIIPPNPPVNLIWWVICGVPIFIILVLVSYTFSSTIAVTKIKKKYCPTNEELRQFAQSHIEWRKKEIKKLQVLQANLQQQQVMLEKEIAKLSSIS